MRPLNPALSPVITVAIDRRDGSLVLRCLVHDVALVIPPAARTFGARVVEFCLQHDGCAAPAR